MLFMGLDVGTQGARCVVCDEKGSIVASHSVPFDKMNASVVKGYLEQRPGDWQSASEESIKACADAVVKAGYTADDIYSISIDGTSGTIVPLDKEFKSLTNGIMYNDPRAKKEAGFVHESMKRHEEKLGLKFGSSFSLPRILWIKNNQPEIYEKTRVFAHQADYIAGLLCGEYMVSDYSNALKTGYDMIDGNWPDEISSKLQIDAGKLPRVVRPGEAFANISGLAAKRLGLSEKTLVTGGSTDGYASALAAGAVKRGDWASIIGTTFVLKGVTEDLVIDPDGSSYSHRLPDGSWLLGGASNVGGKCLSVMFNSADFRRLDEEAEKTAPTGLRCYPLTGTGERFPFVKPDAKAFFIGDIFTGNLYRALMEGVGYAERLAYEKMENLGLDVRSCVFTTGGACKSRIWLSIRASILNRQLIVPKTVDAAMGSALLAASAQFGSLSAAAKDMVKIDRRVDPIKEWALAYEDIYALFKSDVKKLYGVEV